MPTPQAKDTGIYHYLGLDGYRIQLGLRSMGWDANRTMLPANYLGNEVMQDAHGALVPTSHQNPHRYSRNKRTRDSRRRDHGHRASARAACTLGLETRRTQRVEQVEACIRNVVQAFPGDLRKTPFDHAADWQGCIGR